MDPRGEEKHVIIRKKVPGGKAEALSGTHSSISLAHCSQNGCLASTRALYPYRHPMAKLSRQEAEEAKAFLVGDFGWDRREGNSSELQEPVILQ